MNFINIIFAIHFGSPLFFMVAVGHCSQSTYVRLYLLDSVYRFTCFAIENGKKCIFKKFHRMYTFILISLSSHLKTTYITFVFTLFVCWVIFWLENSFHSTFNLHFVFICAFWWFDSCNSAREKTPAHTQLKCITTHTHIYKWVHVGASLSAPFSFIHVITLYKWLFSLFSFDF